MADLSSLSIFPATPEQLYESRRRTHAAWNRGLSVEQYVQRDNVMDDQEHAANGKLITWVLAPRHDPTTLDFMCSCETFQRACIAASPSSASASDIVGYGVASVFTPPHLRGRGYASHMTRILHWALAPHSSLPTPFPSEWGTPPDGPRDAAFSMLYSDVGKEFYARCGPAPGHSGWDVANITSTQWDVPSQDPGSGGDKGWKWLSRDECIDVWRRDAALMRDELPAIARRRGKTVFACLPDKGVGQFSIQRLMTFDEQLRPIYPLEPWGVQLVDREEITFATWTFEPGTKIVVLTRLRASPETFPELLAALMVKARELGFETIETWDMPEELREVGQSLGSRTLERTEHISAAKWYGDEAGAEWVFNEKFGWC